MKPETIAIAIMASTVFVALAVGLIAARANVKDPEQFLVGGRSFGALIMWLLSAGELYTSFTFLGAAGWAYGKGAPAFYILCYGPLAYIIAYFTMPYVWAAGKRFGLLTIGDFFRVRYESRGLVALAALLGFVFLLPYVTLQLTALQVLLGIAGYGAIAARNAVFIAVAAIAGFVFLTGIRGTAWTSVVKDALVLAAVVFAGVALPVHFFGSPATVIAKVQDAHPGWLVLSRSGTYTPLWFVSTVLLNGIAFFLFPQSTAAVYSAKNAESLRRNYVFLPLYQVALLLVIFAGLTALLVKPGLAGSDADRSFMLVVAQYYPPWVLGSIAGAGCLAALVPVSAQLLAAAGLLVRNLFEDALRWRPTERQRSAAMRAFVLVLAAGAVILWASENATLVDLLLFSYNGMAQYIPGFLFGFAWRKASAWGIAAGIAAGLAALAVAGRKATLFGLNIGLVAVGLNAAVAVVVSVLTRPPAQATVDRFRASAELVQES